MAAAVARLYETFARYPLRAPVKGCAHCVSREYEALLEALPLRGLRAEHLHLFAFKALTTWGDEDDFRHFLPRIFELAAPDQLGVSLETVLGKLRYGDWRTWPAEEQRTVDAYLTSLWRQTLDDDGRGPHSAQDVLVAIAAADDRIQSFLDEWVTCAERSEAAAAHLAEFVTDIADVRRVRQGVLRVSGLFNEPERLVSRWLRSGVPTRRLEDAFFRAGRPDTQERLSTAITYLEPVCAVLSPEG
jgi:hypothetical protein